MNKRRLLASVLNPLKVELRQTGFEFKPVDKWFVRRDETRIEKYQVVFLNERDGYRLQLFVAVRFEDVETIFHRTSRWEPEYQYCTDTVGAFLHDLYGDEGYDLSLRSESDVLLILDRTLEVFFSDGLAYYSTFPDHKAVDSALNTNPTEYCIHHVSPWRRCSLGLIGAKLVQNPRLDELKQIYRAQMEELNDGFYLPPFDDLIADLGI